jgi:hypothetical protein
MPGGIIPIFGNQSIVGIMGADGRVLHFTQNLVNVLHDK